jgi:diguanylate cyclase (GGDEF)-like protein/putative nucleotidyltransferase with HDIG domain
VRKRAQYAEKERHADEMAALHLRAIEGLACAVEAKDLLNTKGHLRRVQVFCLEIGKEFGLIGDDMEALRAASLLHDVGKLAVPEQILAKPGRLTPEEFAKMKVHPVVGAEIVEQVRFPYPVAPIVRAHHEKWDGTGYPLGLKGGQIPLGARILTAVDCLDALTSDREYRRAVSFDEAMDQIRSESGTTFDPTVVEAISRRYRNLEELAKDLPATGPLPTRADAANGATPGAGFDLAGSATGNRPLDFIGMISAAQREDRFVVEFTQSLAGPMGLEETFSRVERGLAEAIPFDAFAVLNRHANLLTAEFAAGSNADMLALLEVPVGEGMTGWVAEHAAPVVNGNPAVDPDFVCAPGEPLRSALAVPLEGSAGVLGVLVLYHRQSDAFTADHLRLVRGLSGKIAQAVDNAMKFRASQRSDNTDLLTGLPNRVLLAQALESELIRARRQNQPVSAVTCVLSGLRRLHRERGRAEADQLVQRVALALKQDCRQYDHLGHTGREEFVLLLPGMHPDMLAAKITRLRSNIAQVGLEPVELKVGAAFYPDDGDTHGVLLEIARHRASGPTPEPDEEGSALSTLQEALEKEQGMHERATS